MILYLIALAIQDARQANAACFKCGTLLLAAYSMRRVSSSARCVFTCPTCLPASQAANALVSLADLERASEVLLRDRAKAEAN